VSGESVVRVTARSSFLTVAEDEFSVLLRIDSGGVSAGDGDWHSANWIEGYAFRYSHVIVSGVHS